MGLPPEWIMDLAGSMGLSEDVPSWKRNAELIQRAVAARDKRLAEFLFCVKFTLTRLDADRLLSEFRKQEDQ